MDTHVATHVSIIALVCSCVLLPLLLLLLCFALCVFARLCVLNICFDRFRYVFICFCLCFVCFCVVLCVFVLCLALPCFALLWCAWPCWENNCNARVHYRALASRLLCFALLRLACLGLAWFSLMRLGFALRCLIRLGLATLKNAWEKQSKDEAKGQLQTHKLQRVGSQLALCVFVCVCRLSTVCVCFFACVGMCWCVFVYVCVGWRVSISS